MWSIFLLPFVFFLPFLSENQNNCVTLEAVSMGGCHRFSARLIYELQDLMEQTFKAMAGREEEGDAEISHTTFPKKMM